jgi:uncharacterized membrane protein
MNQKIVPVVLGIVQILIALFYFDWSSTNQIFVSILLFLSGTSLLLSIAESVSIKKASRFLLIAAGALGVLLLFKVLLVG